jgi:hypothetical protein
MGQRNVEHLDMVLLICLVHPVDPQAQPTVPPGFRWAVMLGPGLDLDMCANAGWAPDARAAEAEGDQNAATATRVLQLIGFRARYGGVKHLDHDPIPPGADRINLV